MHNGGLEQAAPGRSPVYKLFLIPTTIRAGGTMAYFNDPKVRAVKELAPGVRTRTFWGGGTNAIVSRGDRR